MVRPERLESLVKVLTTKYRDINLKHLKTMQNCATWLKIQLGFDNVFFQPVPFQDKTTFNIGRKFGHDESKSTVIIGAHYDSEIASQTPGADDNASGVSLVIELARALSKTPEKALKHNIITVLYTNEEAPFFLTEFMGSAHFAALTRQENINVEYTMSLDMIGRFTDKQDYPNALYKAFYPDHGQFLACIGDLKSYPLMRNLKKQSPLQIENLVVPRAARLFWRSDHVNYWFNDIPGVLITDTADLRHADYHSPSDTWDKLNYFKMAQLGEGIIKCLIK